MVNGRKSKPEGIAPLYNESKDAVVDSFEDLYNKINEVRNENLLQPRTDAELRHSNIASMQSSREIRSQETDRPEDIPAKPSGRTYGEERAGTLGINETNRRQSGSGESVHKQYERGSRNVIGKPALPEGVQREGTIGRDIQPTRSGDDIRRYFDRGSNPTVTRKDLLEKDKPNIPYTPQSKGVPLDTHIPKNMAYDTFRQLKALEEELGGDIDQFVVDKLGYESKEELYQYLGAEQIDAVAFKV